MGVPVAARRHYQPFIGVIDNFSLALFDKRFSTRFVADINKFAVLNRERLDDFVVFWRENLAVNDQIRRLISAAARRRIAIAAATCDHETECRQRRCLDKISSG